AGGKTTMVNRLTESLRKEHKILVSSTTTFIKPSITSYDFIDYYYNQEYDLGAIGENGIYMIGRGRTQEDLVMGVEKEDIEYLSAGFDHTIIECDFSNGRPLKGFRDYEPIIPNTTDVTVGIIDIQALGLLVNSANIHNLDKYIELTGSTIGSLVTIKHLAKIIDDKNALFKNAVGKKVLFINKVEKELDQALALSLYEAINLDQLDLVIEGSLVMERYDVLFDNKNY
ncbi:MAG: putative selenium-dependent hydroxylase accessory protein YqeC, partial [Clostridium sp.]|nr:putative selenium-dependent hydroxylase accessory protein YqeC [Clostridium sp.]